MKKIIICKNCFFKKLDYKPLKTYTKHEDTKVAEKLKLKIDAKISIFLTIISFDISKILYEDTEYY